VRIIKAIIARLLLALKSEVSGAEIPDDPVVSE
jgi:hypothetical protein